METIRDIAEATWLIIGPLVMVLVTIYGRPIANAVIAWLNAKTNVALSERDVALLQSALGNAAWSMGSKVFGSKAVITQLGQDYLKTSVPDLARKMEILDDAGHVNVEKLDTLITPHVERVKTELLKRRPVAPERRDPNDPSGKAQEGL